MVNKLKNFAINRVLKHIAENPKLNTATNVLAIIPVVLLAVVNGGANWSLMFQCCAAPGSLHEVLRVGGLIVTTALLFLTGKFPGLKSWLPTASEIILEAEKEIEQVKQPVEKSK